jgi:hypothetical protein
MRLDSATFGWLSQGAKMESISTSDTAFTLYMRLRARARVGYSYTIYHDRCDTCGLTFDYDALQLILHACVGGETLVLGVPDGEGMTRDANAEYE